MPIKNVVFRGKEYLDEVTPNVASIFDSLVPPTAAAAGKAAQDSMNSSNANKEEDDDVLFDIRKRHADIYRFVSLFESLEDAFVNYRFDYIGTNFVGLGVETPAGMETEQVAKRERRKVMKILKAFDMGSNETFTANDLVMALQSVTHCLWLRAKDIVEILKFIGLRCQKEQRVEAELRRVQRREARMLHMREKKSTYASNNNSTEKKKKPMKTEKVEDVKEAVIEEAAPIIGEGVNSIFLEPRRNSCRNSGQEEEGLDHVGSTSRGRDIVGEYDSAGGRDSVLGERDSVGDWKRETLFGSRRMSVSSLKSRGPALLKSGLSRASFDEDAQMLLNETALPAVNSTHDTPSIRLGCTGDGQAPNPRMSIKTRLVLQKMQGQSQTLSPQLKPHGSRSSIKEDEARGGSHHEEAKGGSKKKAMGSSSRAVVVKTPSKESENDAGKTTKLDRSALGVPRAMPRKVSIVESIVEDGGADGEASTGLEAAGKMFWKSLDSRSSSWGSSVCGRPARSVFGFSGADYLDNIVFESDDSDISSDSDHGRMLGESSRVMRSRKPSSSKQVSFPGMEASVNVASVGAKSLGFKSAGNGTAFGAVVGGKRDGKDGNKGIKLGYANILEGNIRDKSSSTSAVKTDPVQSKYARNKNFDTSGHHLVSKYWEKTLTRSIRYESELRITLLDDKGQVDMPDSRKKKTSKLGVIHDDPPTQREATTGIRQSLMVPGSVAPVRYNTIELSPRQTQSSLQLSPRSSLNSGALPLSSSTSTLMRADTPEDAHEEEVFDVDDEDVAFFVEKDAQALAGCQFLEHPEVFQALVILAPRCVDPKALLIEVLGSCDWSFNFREDTIFTSAAGLSSDEEELQTLTKAAAARTKRATTKVEGAENDPAAQNSTKVNKRVTQFEAVELIDREIEKDWAVIEAEKAAVIKAAQENATGQAAKNAKKQAARQAARQAAMDRFGACEKEGTSSEELLGSSSLLMSGSDSGDSTTGMLRQPTITVTDADSERRSEEVALALSNPDRVVRLFLQKRRREKALRRVCRCLDPEGEQVLGYIWRAEEFEPDPAVSQKMTYDMLRFKRLFGSLNFFDPYSLIYEPEQMLSKLTDPYVATVLEQRASRRKILQTHLADRVQTRAYAIGMTMMQRSQRSSQSLHNFRRSASNLKCSPRSNSSANSSRKSRGILAGGNNSSGNFLAGSDNSSCNLLASGKSTGATTRIKQLGWMVPHVSAALGHNDVSTLALLDNDCEEVTTSEGAKADSNEPKADHDIIVTLSQKSEKVFEEWCEYSRNVDCSIAQIQVQKKAGQEVLKTIKNDVARNFLNCRMMSFCLDLSVPDDRFILRFIWDFFAQVDRLKNIKNVKSTLIRDQVLDDLNQTTVINYISAMNAGGISTNLGYNLEAPSDSSDDDDSECGSDSESDTEYSIWNPLRSAASQLRASGWNPLRPTLRPNGKSVRVRANPPEEDKQSKNRSANPSADDSTPSLITIPGAALSQTSFFKSMSRFPDSLGTTTGNLNTITNGAILDDYTEVDDAMREVEETIGQKSYAYLKKLMTTSLTNKAADDKLFQGTISFDVWKFGAPLKSIRREKVMKEYLTEEELEKYEKQKQNPPDALSKQELRKLVKMIEKRFAKF